MKIARNIAITLVCIILGIMLAWQYRSINYNKSMAAFEGKRLEELKDELIKLKNQREEQEKRLQELRTENLAYEKAKSGDDESAKQIQKKLEEARIFAGLVDVRGKGLIVTLEDNKFIPVADSDLLDVVNELRAAGAQAISINDERVVAMTEIRGASSYIVINGKQMFSPFVIKAISDPDKLERSLRLLGGVVDNLEEISLNVNIKSADDILIPSVRDDGTVIKSNLLTPVD